MLKDIKIFLILLLCAVSSLSFANSNQIITTYDALTKILEKGALVRALVIPSKCSRSDTSEVKAALAGTILDSFMSYSIQDEGKQKNAIVTSHFRLSQGEHAYVYHYVRWRIFEDGSVKIFSSTLRPQDYTPLKESTMICHLSNGADQNGVILYKLR